MTSTNEFDQAGSKASVFGDVLKANLASDIIVGRVKAIGSAIKAIRSAIKTVSQAFIEALKTGLSTTLRWSNTPPRLPRCSATKLTPNSV